MKRVTMLSLVLILLVLVSCSDQLSSGGEVTNAAANEKITVNGSVTKNLSELNDGDTIEFTLGPSDIVNLQGITTSTLFVVENETPAARNISRNPSPNDQISRVDRMGDGPYIMIPQEDEQVSFSGQDFGVSDDSGKLLLKRIGNGFTNENNYFEYRIHPTDRNYVEEGYPHYLWPTYQSFIHMDLNNPAWSKYRNQKVAVISMPYQHPYTSNFGGTSTERTGLVENGQVIYSDEVRGLIDLTGKTELNLYSFFRTGVYGGENVYYRTYILIPEEFPTQPTTVREFPHLYRIIPENEDTAYEIHMDNVPPRDMFQLVVGTLVGGNPRYTGANAKQNGERVQQMFWLKDITINDDETLNATLYFKGIPEEFIVNFYGQPYDLPKLADISICRAANQNWTAGPNIDVNDSSNHNATFGGDGQPVLHIIPFSIPNGDRSYVLTVSLNPGQEYIRAFEKSGLGGGNRSIFQSEQVEYEYRPGASGYVVLYSDTGEASVTYSIREK